MPRAAGGIYLAAGRALRPELNMNTVGTVKPAPFAYYAPDTLDEALELMADTGRDSRIIAGGQSLVPMMNFRISTPEALVDLRRIAEVHQMEVDSEGALVIGAGVTQRQLTDDERVAHGWPLLVDAVGHIGHPQIRTRGTVCGSLAHHDPSAELPAVALALDAELTVVSTTGRRVVPAADFFISYYETALGPGEVLLQVRFPARPARAGWAFRELSRKRGDFALVGAAAGIERDATGTVHYAVVVLFGVADHARRMAGVEEGLLGQLVTPRLVQVLADRASAAISPVGDHRASGLFRQEVAAELIAATVQQAWERADG